MGSDFGSAGGSAAHRKVKTKATEKFSPSYGVHKGYIRDPNWPPAVIPAKSHATNRRERRVPAKFSVKVGERFVKVSGDLSRGGAMFLLPQVSPTRQVMVKFGEFQALVEVITVNSKDGQVAHHTRFLDRAAAGPLWEAVKAA